MTPRRQALLQRDLITACGGIQEIVEARLMSEARVKKVNSLNQPEELRFGEIVKLEAYCQQPIISRELAGRFSRQTGGDILSACVHLNARTAELTEVVVEALSPSSPGGRHITQEERDASHAALDAAKSAIRVCEGALDAPANVTRLHAAE